MAGASRPAATVVERLPEAARAPHGPAVQKLLAALDASIDMEFSDMSLKDVLAFLQERAKVPILLDPEAEAAAPSLTLKLKDVKLGSALQAIEDACQPTVFVVRDYGLLATLKDTVRQQGYVRVQDLVTGGKAPAGEVIAPAPAKEPR